MPTSTLTSKGQITIPKKVRDRLHLRTGDRLDFRLEDDGTIRLHPIAKKVSEVFGAFSHKGAVPRTSAEARRRLAEAFRHGEL